MELLSREMRHVQRSRYDDVTRFQSCQAFTLDRVAAAVPLRSDGFTLLFSLSGGRLASKSAYAARKRALGVRARPHLLAELHEGRAWGLRGQKNPRGALYLRRWRARSDTSFRPSKALGAVNPPLYIPGRGRIETSLYLVVPRVLDGVRVQGT